MVFSNEILGTWYFQMKMMRKILIVSQGRASYRWHGCQPRAAVSLLNSTHPTLPNAHTQYHSDVPNTNTIPKHTIDGMQYSLHIPNNTATYRCSAKIPHLWYAQTLQNHFDEKNSQIPKSIKTYIHSLLWYFMYHNNFSTLIWSRATSSIAVTTSITERLSSRRYCLWANNSPITTSDTQVTWMLTTALNFSSQSRMVVAVAEDFYWTQARSLPCLVSQSPSQSMFVVGNCWICHSCFVDFSKLIHWFLLVVTWICQNQWMDFSKLLHGFVKNVTRICQSCSMYFLPVAKKTHRSLTKILKLVEASVLN